MTAAGSVYGFNNNNSYFYFPKKFFKDNQKRYPNFNKKDFQVLNFWNLNNKIFSDEREASTIGLQTNYKAGYLKEIEELYNTAAFYQNLKLGKNFGNKFKINLNIYLERAKRVEVDKPDNTRWYDNTTLTTDYMPNEFNKISAFVGGSISDTTLTTYGTFWQASIELGEFSLKNFLTLSHDYFYYWNSVSQNFVSENMELNYSDFKISAGYFFGVVDFNYVDGYEEKAKNPNSQFSLDIKYKLISDPITNIGFVFFTKDFKYYSPLYYSPQNRNITGLYSNVYDQLKDFYFYLGSGIRIDNNNTFIWDFDGEVGYDKNNFSVSIGISRYNDPFYTSYNSFLNFTKLF